MKAYAGRAVIFLVCLGLSIGVPTTAQECSDKGAPGAFTCEEQKGFGKCNASFLKGFCDKTCGRCSGVTSQCSDKIAPGVYTCEEEKGFGKCNASFLKGFCDKTCGRCSDATSQCSDEAPPDSTFTCEQQKGFGKCDASFLKNYCKKTCGRCSSSPSQCSDEAPPGSTFTCEQQKGFGKCNASFLQNYCNKTCGRCSGGSSGCSDEAPPGSKYTCEQQKVFGKCNASFLQNYCNKTCGRCSGGFSGCSDEAPPGSKYTCEQQKGFGKCNASFLQNYCNKTCGRCSGGSSGSPPATSSSPATRPPTSAKLGCSEPDYCYYKDVFGGDYLKECAEAPKVCPGSDCNTVIGRYQDTKIIVADVNSLYYNGGPSKGGPATAIPAECCNQCKNNKNCNVWTYCDNEDGCGEAGSCSAFYAPYDRFEYKELGQFGAGCTDSDKFKKTACILGSYSKSDLSKASSKLDTSPDANFITGLLTYK